MRPRRVALAASSFSVSPTPTFVRPPMGRFVMTLFNGAKTSSAGLTAAVALSDSHAATVVARNNATEARRNPREREDEKQVIQPPEPIRSRELCVTIGSERAS